LLDSARIVFVKETLDNLRDRRSALLGLVYPLLGPIVLGVLILFVGQVVLRPAASELRISIQGAASAPDLVAHLEGRGAVIDDPTDDPEVLVRTGRRPLVLVVPEDYQARIDGGLTARLKLLVDPARLGSVMALGRVLDMVRDYSQTVSAARLRAHGLNPEIAAAIKVETVSVSGGRNVAGIFLNMLPPFLMFTIFIGGVYLAIDTTAGERERGSLEPLLINPVARWELMLGKFAASWLFTALAVTTTLIAYTLMFRLVIWADIGIRAQPSLGTFALVFLVAAPVMALAVAVQVVIATVTRSYKETQTYLGLLPLLPSLPGMIMVFAPVTGQGWMMLVPTFGQNILFGALIRGEPVDPVQVALASVSTLALAALVLVFAARCYESEQVAFAA
jgi:sodium transport system permease protein